MKKLQNKALISKVFLITNKLKNVLVSLPYRLFPAYVRLNHIGSACRESRLLYLAVKLELVQSISDKKVLIDELAKTLNLNEEHLYRVLRALVSIGVFLEVEPRVFVNNRLSKALLSSNKWNINKPLLNDPLDLVNSMEFRSFKSGLHPNENTFKKVYKEHSSINHDFSNGANSFDGFNWSSFDLVFDSGNATGEHILQMFRSSKELNICVYDHTSAIHSAKIFWQGEQLQDSNIRLSFEEGDMLKSLPKASSQRNLYCFVSVFSGLSDADCLAILTNVGEAIGIFNATVAIVDLVLPTLGLQASDALDDIQLLLENGGQHRTINQWKTLIAQSDFSLDEVVDIRSSNKVLVLRKT